MAPAGRHCCRMKGAQTICQSLRDVIQTLVYCITDKFCASVTLTFLKCRTFTLKIVNECRSTIDFFLNYSNVLGPSRVQIRNLLSEGPVLCVEDIGFNRQLGSDFSDLLIQLREIFGLTLEICGCQG
jgi:hypothetical protein